MKVIYRFLLVMSLSFMGVACSHDNDELPSVTPEATGTMTDARDGFTYHWVRYGGLDWTVENSHFKTSEGTYGIYAQAGLIGDDNAEYDTRTVEKYGYLYNYDGVKEAAPEGWRVPTDEDWKKLEKALGMSADDAEGLEWRGSNEGTLMHSGDSGLNMLYAGYYTYTTTSYGSSYRLISAYGFYWTSTEDTAKGGDYAYYRKLFYNYGGVFRYSCQKKNMLSVRFVRDAK